MLYCELVADKIHTIEIDDKNYPDRLRKISSPPKTLYVRGEKNIDELSAVSIAVVGTRKPTGYGRQVTEKLVEGLVDAGITIVSGLAFGIDAIAHRKTLDTHGKTIGVLASGVDEITPHTNRALGERIIESGGALVSENPPGSPVARHSFPARNRIVSGISLGVLVIEGTDKSGTLLTASHAASQGRDVFAVPGSIFSPTSSAPHILLRQGAKLVEKAEDVLEELGVEVKQKLLNVRSILPQTKEEEKLLEILQKEPLDIDSLVRISGIDAGKLLGVVTTMELKGLIKNIGGIYTKS